MDEFDIGRLTDFDFEMICRDLFEDLLSTRIEIFARGRDGGVDLRHISPTSNARLIIQCKHWYGSSRSTLIHHMKNKEAPKVRSLNPDRYVLATSVSLTVSSKADLAQALHPYLAESDIYGIDEINAMLKARPEIVRRHIRLWLASASILQSLLSNEVLTRSRDLVESLPDTLLKYVPNPSFDRARQLLEAEKVCMIVGNPGIGKSTLARVLCSNYVASGYELYEISADIEEANKVWNDKVRQVFYYDDFLGQTTLEGKLPKNEDRRLVSLLRRVNRLSNKRVIMTTREYILEQARRTYEQLAREDFDPLKCVLDLTDYGESVRASILYNHVYFSDIAPSTKVTFAARRAYAPILHHPNFNPRIIEDSLRRIGNEGVAPGEVVALLLENLDDPDQVWGPIFYEQLDEPARDLMEVLLLLRSDVRFLDLLKAWSSLREVRGTEANPRLFQKSVQLLRGTMIVANGQESPTSFQNPSVADFMRHYFSRRPSAIQQAIDGAAFFEQLEKLWELAVNHPEKELFEIIRKNAARFEQALTWNLFNDEQQVPANQYRCDLAHRISVCLSIAKRLDLDELGDYMADVIVDVSFVEGAASLADVVEVIIQCRSSRSQRLQALAQEMIPEALDAIMLDLSEWRRANLAVELLERLGDLVPEEALDRARGARHKIAQDSIDDLFESGMGATPPEGADVFQEILDYAQSHGAAVSARLDEVWGSIELAEILAERELSEDLSPQYLEVDEVSIPDMFRLLAEKFAE